METKITKKQKYEAIISILTTGETEIDPEVLKEFCEAEIESLDKKAAKAKERKAEKAKEAGGLTALVLEALTEEAQGIADITAVVEESDPEATVAKVRYRLTQLEKDGKAVKSEISIKEEGAKARKLVAYALAPEVEE